MQHSLRLMLIVFLSISFFSSCGSNKDGDKKESGQEQLTNGSDGPVESSFDATVDGVTVRGEKCLGTEKVSVNARDYKCERGEWIFTLDNKEIIVDLDDEDDLRDKNYVFYELESESPVTRAEASFLRSYWLRQERSSKALMLVKK